MCSLEGIEMQSDLIPNVHLENSVNNVIHFKTLYFADRCTNYNAGNASFSFSVKKKKPPALHPDSRGSEGSWADPKPRRLASIPFGIGLALSSEPRTGPRWGPGLPRWGRWGPRTTTFLRNARLALGPFFLM